MKFQGLFLLAMVSIGVKSFAQPQSVIGGPYIRSTTAEREPLPYPSLREADVMWSKRIWRVIDLNEKMNLPLKYPLNKLEDRESLIDLLLDAIKGGSLTAYSFESDEFVLPITLKEIAARGGSRADTTRLQRPDPPYEEYDTVIVKEFSPDKVIGYRVKEDWFFDKQRSVMNVRIIGIAPLVYAIDEAGAVRAGNIKIPLFWIYYPEARKLLANANAFNPWNNAQRLSFDDIFEKRFFASYIYKESNVYDRRIEEYRTGVNALLESERIKNDITNFEHDMWEY